jgi:hypothetical protein
MSSVARNVETTRSNASMAVGTFGADASFSKYTAIRSAFVIVVLAQYKS